MDLTTAAGLKAYLRNTEYAAADVQTLSGGTLAFTYRVVLKAPLQSGEASVVVKHGLGYAASDRNKSIAVERMDFDYKALTIIESSGLFSSKSTVQVPRALSYDFKTHTLIMSNLVPTRMLSEVLLECLERGDPTHIRELSS